MFFPRSDRFRDFGLLVLRLGLGIMFIYHGAPKMMAGPAMWYKLGLAMGPLGVHFLPVFWGFMAAFAEFGGGILLIAGFLFRPICAIMAFDMLVAAIMHLKGGQGLSLASHAIEDGIVFVSLIFIGSGPLSFDHLIGARLRKPQKAKSS
jgi:putative oxidoreductase